MTLRNFSQISMTFPEIPENFKIPESPWLFHDRGNPAHVLGPTGYVRLTRKSFSAFYEQEGCTKMGTSEQEAPGC